MSAGLESILGEFIAEHGGSDKTKKSKKLNVIILHGTGGSPEVNWFPWLKKRLEAKKILVEVPILPTPNGQTLNGWFRAFDEQVSGLGPKTILVGHSMGAGFALRLLERVEEAIHATFLVSAWEGLLKNKDFDPLIETFFRQPFNYQLMKQNAGRLKFYHGENDPYVPLIKAQDLAADLDAPLQVVPRGGHLNTESGYLSFKSLLEDILAVLED